MDTCALQLKRSWINCTNPKCPAFIVTLISEVAALEWCSIQGQGLNIQCKQWNHLKSISSAHSIACAKLAESQTSETGKQSSRTQFTKKENDSGIGRDVHQSFFWVLGFDQRPPNEEHHLLILPYPPPPKKKQKNLDHFWPTGNGQPNLPTAQGWKRNLLPFMCRCLTAQVGTLIKDRCYETRGSRSWCHLRTFTQTSSNTFFPRTLSPSITYEVSRSIRIIEGIQRFFLGGLVRCVVPVSGHNNVFIRI